MKVKVAELVAVWVVLEIDFQPKQTIQIASSHMFQ